MTLVFSIRLIVEGERVLQQPGMSTYMHVFMVAADLLRPTQWRSSKNAAPYSLFTINPI
jgi:hypothetical protein